MPQVQPAPYTNGTSSHRSFPSSSEDSYGRVNSHSRSESGTSQTQYDDLYPTPPPSKTLVHEFTRPEIMMNGHSQRDTRDYRKSLRLRQSDPMSMHLLLETALGDSQHYDLLTPDELEDLKQEERLLKRKIQGRKKKLFLESRMHNASRSLQRLDSHARHGSDMSADGPMTSQKVDELSEDLWRLERRQAELQDTRLKHTAGVLQLNHQLQSQNGHDLPRHLNGYDHDEDVGFDFLDGTLDLPSSSDHLIPRLQDISGTVYNLISTSNVHQNLDFPEPPASGGGAEDEVEYIEQGLNTIRGLYEGLLRFLDESRQKGRNLDQSSQQTHAMLGGLWEIIGSGEEDARRNKHAMRNLGSTAREAVGDESDDDFDPSEPFSVQAFSARVQKLCSRAATLSDQQRALREQWGQEKEAQQQSEAGRAAERSRMLEEMQDTHDKHLAGERALQDIKAQLMDAKGRHDQAQQEISFMKQQRELSDKEELNAERQARETSEANFTNQLEGRQREIDGHQTTISSLQTDHSSAASRLREVEEQLATLTLQHKEVETRALEHEATADDRFRQLSRVGNERQDIDAQLAVLSVNLEGAQHRAEDAEKALNEKAQQSEKAEAERQELDAELVRLQTELTVSRAELDGAYGTRAQRAAEGAMPPEVRKELDEQRAAIGSKEGRIEALEKELGELVTAHEGMVRAIVEAEKEREQLEGLVDQLRERIEDLERAVTEERVRTMGRPTSSGVTEKASRPSSSKGGDSASVSVMRNEFKKMTRELRSEHFRSLKAEQDERRRLEAQIRSLRRDQGASTPSSAVISPPPLGKSNLNKSVSAAPLVGL